MSRWLSSYLIAEHMKISVKENGQFKGVAIPKNDSWISTLQSGGNDLF